MANSSVHSEKKLGSYESVFRETPLSKPLDFSLIVTPQHLYGQAYVWEQQGTKDGEPVYQRFECPLEEITKIYINNNVKSSPLYIQCDDNIKGVVHRKRFIIPNLDKVADIVEQIKTVHAAHMKKYEEAQQRELKRRQEAIAASKEDDTAEEEKPAVTIEVSNPSEPDVTVEAPKVQEEPKAPESLDDVAAPATDALTDEETKAVKDIVLTSKPLKSVQELNDDVGESLKVLESLEHEFAEKRMPVVESKAMKKASADEVEAAPVVTVEELEPVQEELPEPEIAAEDEAEDEIELEPAPAPAPSEYSMDEIALPIDIPDEGSIEAKIVTEHIPLPVYEEEEDEEVPAEEEDASEEPAPVEEAPKAEEPAPAPVKAAAPAPAPAASEPSGAMTLEEFQTAAKKLKTMKDSGLLTDEEYNAEKKKLLANLY